MMLEGLEEGGLALSPRIKTNTFILKIDQEGNKVETMQSFSNLNTKSE